MLYAIADLHLPLGVDKPMNIFGSMWDNYVERLADNWQRVVRGGDTVVIAGDFSWATYLEQSERDFEFLEKLNGRKILVKGNHDYWWSTLNKLKQFCAARSFKSVDFLQNNCFMYEDIALCGARGWIHPQWNGFTEEDRKIYDREVLRAELSLKAAPEHRELIFFTHYPVCSDKLENNAMRELLTRYGVNDVVYGHLHGENARRKSVNGIYNGMKYGLVSADTVAFMPQVIR